MKLNCHYRHVPTGDFKGVVPTKQMTALRELGGGISWVVLQVSSRPFESHSLLLVPVRGLRVQLAADLDPSRLPGPGDSGTCLVKLLSEGHPHVAMPLQLPQEIWLINEAMWSPRGSCPLQEVLGGSDWAASCHSSGRISWPPWERQSRWE